MALNPQRNRPLTRVADSIWYAASAPLTFMVLAALLAGTFVFAAIIPQQPVDLTADAAENWLAATTASYRGVGAFLRVIGAFTVLSGPWLRALFAVFGFHLALRLADHLRAARNTLRPAQIAPPAPGLPVVESRLPGPFTEALARVTGVLRMRYPVVVIENDAARAQIYAERRRAGAWAPVLALTGSLLLLIGLLVNDVAGWRAPELALAPGGSAALTAGSDVRISVQEIAGAETAPVARITLTGARAEGEGRIAFSRPVRWGNLWVVQNATGLALTATATDAAGKPLLLQELVAGGAVGEVLRVLFRQTDGEQAFAVPAHNLAFRAVAYSALPDQDITRPVFLVEAFRGADSTPVVSRLVETEETLTIDEVTITLRRDRYVVLAAASLPGLWVLLAGALLLLAGGAWFIGWGPTRAWVDLVEDRDASGIAVRVAAPARARERAERLMAACAAGTPAEGGHAG